MAWLATAGTALTDVSSVIGVITTVFKALTDTDNLQIASVYTHLSLRHCVIGSTEHFGIVGEVIVTVGKQGYPGDQRRYTQILFHAAVDKTKSVVTAAEILNLLGGSSVPTGGAAGGATGGATGSAASGATAGASPKSAKDIMTTLFHNASNDLSAKIDGKRVKTGILFITLHFLTRFNRAAMAGVEQDIRDFFNEVRTSLETEAEITIPATTDPTTHALTIALPTAVRAEAAAKIPVFVRVSFEEHNQIPHFREWH